MAMIRSLLFTEAIVVSLAMLFPLGVFADGPEFLPPQQVGTVQQVAINEASGLAASTRNNGVLWTHNDSRSEPDLRHPRRQ